MDKNILILGAGFLQKPAIEAAKKIGCRAVVVDGNEGAVCVGLSDRFERIDLKDKEGIYEFAKKLQKEGGLRAIFTAGTDFSASVSYAGEKLGLACHSYEAACNASGKVRMRQKFSEAGVPSPKFFGVTKKESELDFVKKCVRELGFPCVVKPVDNMGGRGCRMIRSEDETEDALQTALASSRTENAILEEYMSGDEYSIDALIYDGTMTITGFADRHIFFPPYFIETGHTMPTAISDAKKNELIAVFALAAKALGLSCGAAKADIKYTEKGPMIGEVAARLSGGFMSGWTYPYASHCNLTEQALLIACGKKPSFLEAHRKRIPFTPPPSCGNCGAPYELYELPCVDASAERAWISIPGIVKEVSGLERACSVPFVKDVFPRIGAGDAVVFPHNNVQKCGNVISASPSCTEAIAAAEKAVSKIVLRLEPCVPETDTFFADASFAASESGEVKNRTADKTAEAQSLVQKAEVNSSRFPPDAYGAASAAVESEDAYGSAFAATSRQDASVCSAIDWKSVTGVIPKGARASDCVPRVLQRLYESDERDWNHRSFAESCAVFDELCPDHPDLDAKKFWRAGLRGGVQGMLYFADTIDRVNAGL
ncbi:ATP-grasp domain-containing protein [Treponema sp. Marseille-Q4130]|uniref:ATP-grasp domain-containing protein n=1 Tax=Treponema sp. Marseille-Q4130 TaxID=2766702 RepID=UPI001651C4D2|nr:ATP-grasp domain-containing protein [Treponema sp. Marseille-Q4130]MBC6721256.1 ATP-grasp domain-containing protein [Treponema sp. Marseille-Q4130]